MSKLSGIKDVDREIMNKLDDKDILKTCSINKYTWEKVCDDDFLKRRLYKYPEIVKYKYELETWKHFFLRVVNYITLMKEKFNYDYNFGNFVIQYNLLQKYCNDWGEILFESSRVGELSLVIWSLKSGANIHDGNDFALKTASYNGQLETVKYLVEAGANIHAQDDFALRSASNYGHLEVVKYLIKSGANIHAENNEALRTAKLQGHLKIVKYLESGNYLESKN